MGKRLIHPNQETTLELPYSEVCMHLRVAGTRMRARLVADGMVQLLDPEGREFSFPITAAEAGLDHDHDGWFSVVADPPADPFSTVCFLMNAGSISMPDPGPVGTVTTPFSVFNEDVLHSNGTSSLRPLNSW